MSSHRFLICGRWTAVDSDPAFSTRGLPDAEGVQFKMRPILWKWTCFAWVYSLVLVQAAVGLAQESSIEGDPGPVFPLDEEGRLVQFQRDIAPILRDRCLECHGPEDAKNDFRVDDRDMVMDYIEPEDFESSTMYVDYLTIDDADMLMPPETHGGPLTSQELALIRVWIQEGADWPEETEISRVAAQADQTVRPPASQPESVPERVWVAQGVLHPATVHFPIALFLLGGGFVVLGWKWPSVGTQIPLACLLIGAVSAVAASAMGWAFAPQQGYGSGWDFLDWDREIDVHRWSGVIVAIVSGFFAIVALIALWKDSRSLTTVWKAGLLFCALVVGLVGHQGGELSYGKDLYPKAFRILMGEPEPASPPLETTADASP